MAWLSAVSHFFDVVLRCGGPPPGAGGSSLKSILRRLNALEDWAPRHWLALVNAGAAVFAGLPVLAPALMAVGWHAPALLIYSLYRTTCHQWPGRSYFLFGPQLAYAMEDLEQSGIGMAHDFLGNAALGFKMAYCERNFAIYTAVLLAGLLYALVRTRARPLPWLAFVVLLLPIALDGLSQLVGLRESSWELRTLTGALAGLAGVWLVYPRLDRMLRPAAQPAAASGPASVERAWPSARRQPR
jgi:uncharacterized membrane protein